MPSYTITISALQDQFLSQVAQRNNLTNEQAVDEFVGQYLTNIAKRQFERRFERLPLAQQKGIIDTL